jgi:hypothetical protein
VKQSVSVDIPKSAVILVGYCIRERWKRAITGTGVHRTTRN